ncbi:MAG: hypothetical protein DMG79_14895 [Acidobacteria bacterium]|nr:MAG: hypothetical protein DMG79_14895 [Acidobacteriota bacterium]
MPNKVGVPNIVIVGVCTLRKFYKNYFRRFSMLCKIRNLTFTFVSALPVFSIGYLYHSEVLILDRVDLF